MRRLILGAAVLVVLGMAGGGRAADDRHGAIAAAPDGRYGYSYDHESRAAAEAAALGKCGSHGCTVKVWFKNNCAAYARGRGGVEGWAWSDTRSQAESRAVDECSARGAGCQVVCWACNGR